jgi:hypothetical protein
MNDYTNFDNNSDEFAFSFSDELPFGAMQKIQSAFGGENDALKKYAANVLIGNIAAKKVNENVGDEFTMYGFHAKKFKYKDNNRDGVYTIMFGYFNGESCAYCSSSDKIYESIMSILYVYGDVSNWKNGVTVRIRMNTISNGKAYCLEIV